MATGAAWPNGDSKALWNLVYKINTQDKGFFFKVHVADKVEADALTVANDLGVRIKAMLPPDAEVIYATISRWDNKRDSRYVAAAVGAGSFAVADEVAPQVFDNAPTALLFRFEATGEGFFLQKFAPLPDVVVTAGGLVASITAVVGTPLALPAAPVAEEAYAVTVNAFLKAVAFQCHHVKSGFLPGGEYTYDTIKNVYVRRVAVKKGARVFSS